MVDLVYSPTGFLFFDIPLLYYYINLRSSIVCCVFWGDIYLSLGVSISLTELLCGKLFEAFVILLENILPIGSPVASAVLDFPFSKQF